MLSGVDKVSGISARDSGVFHKQWASAECVGAAAWFVGQAGIAAERAAEHAGHPRFRAVSSGDFVGPAPEIILATRT